MKQGDVYVNSVKGDVEAAVVSVDKLLHGRWPVQRRGKKSLAASCNPLVSPNLAKVVNLASVDQGETPPRATAG